MLHSPNPRTMLKDQDFPIALEVQLLGGLSNGKPRNRQPVHTRLERRLQRPAATAHCTNSSSMTYDGDQWVASGGACPRRTSSCVTWSADRR
jgi:hypothetical protein